MAPIISEKFRIFNAKQFVESLSEAAPSTMYFFVGRPQAWYTYIEVSNVTGTFNLTIQEVVNGSTWSGNIVETLPVGATAGRIKAILVRNFSPTNATAAFGSSVTGATSGATATVGETFRYGTEDSPTQPYDSQAEKYEIYDDIIAAKRITSDKVRHVIRKYSWATYQGSTGLGTDVGNGYGDFDMWRPDYSVERPGKSGAVSIATARFFTINSRYQVFVCLYNAEDQGPNAQYSLVEPDTAAAGYNSATGTFTELDTNSNLKYLWRYYYTIPTESVTSFVSSDFMPIETYGTGADSLLGDAPAITDVDGKLYAALIQDGGTGYGNNVTRYLQILGDGTDGVLKIKTNGSGVITTAEVVGRGTGYTYASVDLSGQVANLYSTFTESSPGSGEGTLTGLQGSYTPTEKADIEIVLPVQGGHGVNLIEELNAKRVMANIKLTYAEGFGDFPVDNDFRRIGIIRDPLKAADSTTLTDSTVSNLYGIYVTLNSPNTDFSVDEEISQAVSGGTARGRVVSWKRTGANNGWLKYFQSPEYHATDGVVRAFSGTVNNITGATSGISGKIDGTYNATASASGVGMAFTSGLATPELKNNSGEIIYVENRRLITRAADQIEDIKLVIEF